MTTHDNGDVSTAGPGTAMVQAGSASGGALASPFAGMGAAAAKDVIKGGMDRSGLLNALRRRWLLATCMSTLAGLAAGAGLWLLFPETFSAKAYYKVASDPVTLVDSRAANQTSDFDVFRATQIASIKSPYVLSAALRNSNIGRHKFFPQNPSDDKVMWLRDQLQVSFPNDGELLEISVAGPYPREELKEIIEAVSESYYNEVVYRDRVLRQQPLQILKESFADLEEEIRDEMIAYQQLAEDSGTSAAYSDGFDPETKLMLAEITRMQGEQMKLQTQLMQATMEYQIFERQINDPSYIDAQVDQQLAADPTIGQMQAQVLGLDLQIQQLRTTVKRGSSPEVRRLLRQRDQLNQQIAAMRDQMRAQLAGQNSDEPNPLLKAQTTSFALTRGTLSRELERIEKRIAELQEGLLEKAVNNTDLMLRQTKIEQQRNIQQSIATKIQNLAVELKAPARISALSNPQGAAPAETSSARNLLARAAISSIGGLGALMLTCLGIGFMEFNNRRLDGPEQVDEGLGIRVIGTLPSLSGRKALNPRHPVVAQLSESIDSVRTALMHESTKKARRLVMVTSATTGEGRTTVASQLAASLARAGRRTLLVDGDLRRPILHTLFNLPLEDGLSEVLRAEADATDVARPVESTEGLWVVTAGYCDTDAVKALATDQAEPIFKQLRDSYDFVIIDGPPVLGLSDSLLFGQHCDGVILSVLKDFSNVPKVNQAADLLRSVGVRLIGSVVNGVSSKADRRVTHLQQVASKSSQPKLETIDG
ncbi:polysaccharide biosynthesis tyrosine autokinase [Botrimarina hoheduenensis]|uniref:Tyrosine-protein kinase YwqD n=1 Tax=Botrimarina hoheduenensis TaxID=2528000 RepID=A0A5C5WAR9_9BACT|nr:polysaccharide biosynthesis tyrosine autokinase [Botrimarina hoheduenensis]TWT47265.1 Tyrosine-protein kinase YwqD [Botrimarina hoheduenensis]